MVKDRCSLGQFFETECKEVKNKITIELTNNYSGDFGIIVKSITLTDKEDQTKQCELIFT